MADKPDIVIEGEQWLPIKGYEGLYEISNYGRVKSVARTMPHKTHGTWKIRERILTQHWGGKPNDQYRIVWLHKGKGEQHIFRVHRLVAEHFIPAIDGKPVVNHKDCNRDNNCSDNLEWCTNLENTHHAWEHGRCENVGNYQCVPVMCIETGERFDSLKSAGQAYGIGGENIGRQIAGKVKTAANRTWRYADAR